MSSATYVRTKKWNGENRRKNINKITAEINKMEN